MQIAALIIGLVGALFGLVTGWLQYGVSELTRGFVGIAHGGPGIFNLIAPMIGFVGAALALANPVLSACMMLLSAVLILALFNFGWLSAGPILLLVTAGVLLLSGTPEGLAWLRMKTQKSPPGSPPAGLADMASRLGKFLGPSGRAAGRADYPHVPNGGHAQKGRNDVRLLGVDGSMHFTLPHRKLRAGGVKLGRSHECDVVIAHTSISRVHARIYLDSSGRVVAEDLNSANGTWHNDARIKSAVLSDSSTLRLGHAAFKVHV